MKSMPLSSINIKKVEIEGDSQSLEKEDKQRISNVRTQFYSLNEKFEKLLKFKPLLKIHLMQTEMHMPASYNIFQSFKLEEKIHSMDEYIRQLEVQLDLKDYYDIKRPTVVQFTMINNSLKVTRYDLLSDVH
jgi:predicted enzyme involved in methoxymalonyl-ACP biosynthesis